MVKDSCNKLHIALGAPLMMQYHPHTHALTEICNIYCVFTVTVVSRTRLIVTVYVPCHCCLKRIQYEGRKQTF